jgi:hypothetical protein
LRQNGIPPVFPLRNFVIQSSMSVTYDFFLAQTFG